jgi:hypothetical protein
MKKIIYLCPHCRSGHNYSREVQLCQIAKKNNLSNEDIFKYAVIRDEVKMCYDMKLEDDYDVDLSALGLLL